MRLMLVISLFLLACSDSVTVDESTSPKAFKRRVNFDDGTTSEILIERNGDHWQATLTGAGSSTEFSSEVTTAPLPWGLHFKDYCSRDSVLVIDEKVARFKVIDYSVEARLAESPRTTNHSLSGKWKVYAEGVTTVPFADPVTGLTYIVSGQFSLRVNRKLIALVTSNDSWDFQPITATAYKTTTIEYPTIWCTVWGLRDGDIIRFAVPRFIDTAETTLEAKLNFLGSTNELIFAYDTTTPIVAKQEIPDFR